MSTDILDRLKKLEETNALLNLELSSTRKSLKTLQDQMLEVQYHNPSNREFVPDKKDWCDHEPGKPIIISKMGPAPDCKMYEMVVGWICAKCKSHTGCNHVCQMYHCNTPVKCGFVFCIDCITKQELQKEYDKQKKMCPRCSYYPPPLPANAFHGGFCHKHK